MKTITKQELQLVLELHTKWLNNEEGGERADLSGTNLRFADLTGTDLTDIDLRYADLEDVKGLK